MKSLANAVRMVGLICALCLLGADASANPLPSFDDGEFLSGTWSHVVLLEGGVGAGTVTRQTSGGNPGAFLEVSTQSGWDLHMWVAMWKNDIYWDPSEYGPADSLGFMIDEKAISSFGSGQNIKLLVVQEGRYYLAPLVPWTTTSGTGTTWETIIFDPVTEDDFGEIPPLPYDPTGKPDFSSTGAPVYFGFAVGVSSVLDPRIHGYDNWTVWLYVPPVAVESETWSRIKGQYR
jgi:hypothetical protein